MTDRRNPTFADRQSDRQGIPTAKLADVMVDDSANTVARGVGKADTNLDKALKEYDSARMAVFNASDAMHKQMEDQSRRTKEAVSRAKDAAAQMTDAMNKISKVLGPDFEKRLAQLSELTHCMERLAALNASGLLPNMLEAMRK